METIYPKVSFELDSNAQVNRENEQPMSANQYGAMMGVCQDLGWTWDDMVLFTKLFTGYPFNEITKERPIILTTIEARPLIKYLFKLRKYKTNQGKISPEGLKQILSTFEKLAVEKPNVIDEFISYLHEQGRNLSPAIQRMLTSLSPTKENLSSISHKSSSKTELRTKTYRHCRTCGEDYVGPMFDKARVCMVCTTPLEIYHSCLTCNKLLPDDPELNYCLKCGVSLHVSDEPNHDISSETIAKSEAQKENGMKGLSLPSNERYRLGLKLMEIAKSLQIDVYDLHVYSSEHGGNGTMVDEKFLPATFVEFLFVEKWLKSQVKSDQSVFDTDPLISDYSPLNNLSEGEYKDPFNTNDEDDLPF